MSRRILVTGASRGIGRAVAQAFARQGDVVVVHYGSARDDAERTLASLSGSGHVLVQGDIANPDAARAVVEDGVQALGGIDVLVNNAAVAPTPKNRHRIDDINYEDWQGAWRRMVDVNLLGAANMTYCVATKLIERNASGSVVNIGSRGAFRGEPDFPAYGAAKAALHAFGQSMALALAPHNISVASVAPGFVSTERQLDKLGGSEGDAIRSESPLGRTGTPDDIAAAVLYLASPEAMWSTGAILDVNGASYLRT